MLLIVDLPTLYSLQSTVLEDDRDGSRTVSKGYEARKE